ncbi:hypothetical protein HU727_025255 [Pseudomonas sp. SWRI153]|uniref:Uncharacterized protein n=1 Tax=Pseudomonas khorasanensis TaxID=2745508 RepID=A0A923JHI1_9PSED|nr:hypothetical protein [Pseudomonas khorasanensis]MBV4488904.1 hypothetical protein [Pseudomonas khorasanensis]
MPQYFQRAEEIRHLSDEQIEQIYQRYLDGEKTAELMAEFQIPSTVRSLLKVLPPIISPDLTCPYCALPMWVRRHARGTSALLRSPYKCVRCEHLYSAPGANSRRTTCSCKQCFMVHQQQVAARAARDRLELEARYGALCPAVPYANLGFVQKLTLLALLDDGYGVNVEWVAPLNAPSREELLALTHEAREELLKRLHEAGVLAVSTDSDIKAFDRTEGCCIREYSAVRWLPNVMLDGTVRSTRESLYLALYQELSGNVKEAWKSEIYSLIFSLAREDSIQYIRVLASEVDFAFTAEARAEEVVGQLLQDFSVSQLYYFARLAVRNAAHFYATGNSNGRSHASNTIPRNMLGTAQDALARNWRKNAHRDPRVPQTALYRLLYDVVLKDSGAGFSKSPGMYWRDELVPQFFCAAAFDSDLLGHLRLFCRECDSSNIDASMNKQILQTMCYDCATVSKFRAYEELPD